jgi:hypothetical protein
MVAMAGGVNPMLLTLKCLKEAISSVFAFWNSFVWASGFSNSSSESHFLCTTYTLLGIFSTFTFI